MKEQIARRFPYCTLCLGESETTLCELTEVFETGGDRAKVNGLAYFDNGELRITPERELIADLDELPFARHEAFFNERRGTAEILTSRGCPFACTFCVLDTLSRRKIRYRSAPAVIDEIEYILTTFPQVNTIQILDDQFFANNKRVIELCDEIARRNVQCAFECSGRMKPLSKDVVFAMERANFKTVYLGLETGSPSVLKRTRKGITTEDAVNAFELFRHSPINIYVLMIVGLPGESLATILESAALLQRLQKIKYHTYSHRVSTLFVYPGTQIHDLCLEAGAFDDDHWLTDEDVPYLYGGAYARRAGRIRRDPADLRLTGALDDAGWVGRSEAHVARYHCLRLDLRRVGAHCESGPQGHGRAFRGRVDYLHH